MKIKLTHPFEAVRQDDGQWVVKIKRRNTWWTVAETYGADNIGNSEEMAKYIAAALNFFLKG